MKAEAMVHSLNRTAEVEIVYQQGNNNVIAKRGSNYYTAIYNPFVGLYYVDDIYGQVTKEQLSAMGIYVKD